MPQRLSGVWQLDSHSDFVLSIALVSNECSRWRMLLCRSARLSTRIEFLIRIAPFHRTARLASLQFTHVNATISVASKSMHSSRWLWRQREKFAEGRLWSVELREKRIFDLTVEFLHSLFRSYPPAMSKKRVLFSVSTRTMIISMDLQRNFSL